MRHVDRTVKLGTRLKRAMQKKGVYRARAECPECPGKWINGRISGPRDHLHYACECGKYRMME